MKIRSEFKPDRLHRGGGITDDDMALPAFRRKDKRRMALPRPWSRRKLLRLFLEKLGLIKPPAETTRRGDDPSATISVTNSHPYFNDRRPS